MAPVPPPHKGIEFPALIKYLYFVRFSLLLWAFFPLLVALDWSGKLAAMTRGIVAMDSGWHLFFASFFVVAAGWVALLSARIVCAYGKERLGCRPPWYFAVGDKMSWWAFLGAQIPGFFLLGYAGHATGVEQGVGRVVEHGVEVIKPPALGAVSISGSILMGIFLALACWTLMAGIYYWMFWQDGTAANPAKAFVVPYAGIFKRFEKDPPSAPLVGLLRLFESAVCLGRGYADPARGTFKLHSGLSFAFLTLGFLAAIYLAFWHFTAPVELEDVRWIVRIIFILAALLWTFLSVISLPTRRRLGRERVGSDWLRMVVLFLPLLGIVWLALFVGNQPFAMPVVGFMTVLVTFVSWGLAGLAFWLDRFRVPVLGSILVFFFASNLVLGKWAGLGEHYITSYPLEAAKDKKAEQGTQPALPTLKQVLCRFEGGPQQDTQSALPTPQQILCRFEGDEDRDHMKTIRPVIVVTATGGGIHAAAWTSVALNAIEEKFAGDPKLSPATFHNSILLMSTVSGGSVGTVPWLTHYIDGEFKYDDDIFKIPDVAVSGCSDLQAVAWGLTYTDFLRVLVPIRISSLGRSLNQYDRGWALEQAFGRNRKARCNPDEFSEHVYDSNTDKKISEFDLRKYLDPQNQKSMPAFSFNTTAEETGGRFLIANYEVPRQKDSSEITPAPSFLEFFKQDLPLSTAARLSANFPYISPMPRLEPFKGMDGKSEKEKNHRNYHFGDGGYFDNDGTASAMEFLWYALGSRVAAEPNAPVPVLMIEIRDGEDPSGVDNNDPTKKDWPGSDRGSARHLLQCQSRKRDAPQSPRAVLHGKRARRKSQLHAYRVAVRSMSQERPHGLFSRRATAFVAPDA